MSAKSMVLAGVLIAAAGGAACTQATPATANAEADRAKLEADAVSWFGYYAKADADGMANLYTEDALLMPPAAPAATGRAAIKAFLGDDSAKTKAANLSIRNDKVTGADVSGDMGWISGHYTVVDASGAAIDSGSYLSVHRRTNGTWLYIRDIWNSDRPPAAPAPAPTATK